MLNNIKLNIEPWNYLSDSQKMNHVLYSDSSYTCTHSYYYLFICSYRLKP